MVMQIFFLMIEVLSSGEANKCIESRSLISTLETPSLQLYVHQ
ncbi:hypothetical protein VCRA2126O85_150119 [Vibrio crassostreae]|nr:hypothetical protein VCRA2126O86_120005 [Vibrio crassostreae]CAK2596244.1 hypothetical protein VCRA2127O91_120005 [Vibrio crassostreae]CAK2611120.1 hypothetical protein VCRA2126O84_130005 [Vibrio crassostreae]CAK2652239.1 hypothetical protein VCRA2126O85_150119 [Vibrio crassostreae]CAK2746439.1 hypothetical protein VCRA2125O83_10558 [Vibrio crassostreae]